MSMKSTVATLIAALPLMVQPEIKTEGTRPAIKGSIIPPKDYKRRQKRLKMQKDSRKANRK